MAVSMNMICFYLYRIFSRLYFHLPILFVFFDMQHLSVLYIELLLSAYGLVIVFTAKWNVKLMRYWEQKHVIACGEFLKGLGLALLVIDQHFYTMLAGEIICGLGYSLAAGTDSSLLRSLCDAQDQKQYQKVESGSASYMFLSVLLAGIIGSIVFNYDRFAVFYISMFANACSILTIILIRERNKPGVQQKRIPEGPLERSPGSAAANLSPPQKFWKRYYALSRAFTLAPFVGFLPFYLYHTLHVSLLYFGLVLSLFTILGFFSARYAIRVGARIGEHRLMMLMTALSALAMILFGLFDQLAVGLIAIALLGLASGGVRPLTINHLNRSGTSAELRTTILSSMERVYGFWNACLLIAGGFLIEWAGFHHFMLGLSAAYVVLIILTRCAMTFEENKDHQASIDGAGSKAAN